MECTFREEKSTLEVRSVYHHRDDTTVGHIVGCFLALRLEVDLQCRLEERHVAAPWPDLMRDLAQVQTVSRSPTMGSNIGFAPTCRAIRPPPSLRPASGRPRS